MMEAIRKRLRQSLLLVATLWGVFLVVNVSPLTADHLALRPRTTYGLVGVLTMPLVHASLHHLLNNTWPLFVLLGILCLTHRDIWRTATSIVIVSGSMLWLFGRSVNHIGASALVFGLIAFLVATGYFDRRTTSIVISIAVGLLYGTTFVWGILPLGTGVSWEGHLCGGIAGVLVAYFPRGRNDADRAAEGYQRPIRR